MELKKTIPEQEKTIKVRSIEIEPNGGITVKVRYIEDKNNVSKNISFKEFAGLIGDEEFRNFKQSIAKLVADLVGVDEREVSTDTINIEKDEETEK